VGVAAFSTALRWALLAAGLCFLVLLVSGVYLVWNYRPEPSPGWAVVQGGRPDSLPFTMIDVHQIAARVFVVLALVVATLSVVLAVKRRRVGAGLAGSGWLLAALAGSFTGVLLPWDQIGLWAVTVGSEIRGYSKIVSGDNVRFVMIGSSQISLDTFRRYLFAHVLVIPLVVLGLGWVLVRATRAKSAPDAREVGARAS
jgi:quinol-cytochrome oxidoreductase complex cytochrome b subunit